MVRKIDINARKVTTESPQRARFKLNVDDAMNVKINNLLDDIASTTSRSNDDIRNIATLMEKYPDFAEDIARVVKNKNIKPFAGSSLLEIKIK